MYKPSLWTKNFLIDTIVNFLIYLVYYLLMVIITVFATNTLHTSLSEAGLASGIFILGTLLARLLSGRSIEMVGRKKTLYTGMIFYFLTTLFYFGASSLLILYIIRFFSGVGYGIASTATSTIIANIIPAERRGEGINYYGLSTSIAAAMGPFLGMFLNQHFDFKLIFIFCSILLGLCVFVCFFLDIDEVQLTPEQVTEMKSYKTSNFIEPLVLPIAVVGIFMGLCYSSVLSFLAAYSQEIHLVNEGTFYFVVYALVITVSRPFTGLLFDRKGENFVLYPCYIFLAIGLYLLSQAQNGFLMLLSGAFVGLGYGTFMSNGQAVCVKLSPIHRMGIATSTYFVALDFGLGIGPFLLGFLRPLVGFSGIYMLSAIIALGCLGLYHLLYGRKSGHTLNVENIKAN